MDEVAPIRCGEAQAGTRTVPRGTALTRSARLWNCVSCLRA